MIFDYNKCSFLRSVVSSENFPEIWYENEEKDMISVPEIALIGRSNVGKSSLLNAILNSKKMFRSSSKPGCTKQINFFKLHNKDKQLLLVDMPGYGYSKMSKIESRKIHSLIMTYFMKRKQLSGVFLLIDSRRSIQDCDMHYVDLFCKLHLPFSIIFTKYDKVDSINKIKSREQIQKNISFKKNFLSYINVSVSKRNDGLNLGIETIRDLILQVAGFR